MLGYIGCSLMSLDADESFNDKLHSHRYNRPLFPHQSVLGKLCELY
ncbi:conserved hypothetical protein [Vibrio harveyi]|nr:conserved hypothetical protein [Vibrio harveyi]